MQISGRCALLVVHSRMRQTFDYMRKFCMQTVAIFWRRTPTHWRACDHIWLASIRTHMRSHCTVDLFSTHPSSLIDSFTAQVSFTLFVVVLNEVRSSREIRARSARGCIAVASVSASLWYERFVFWILTESTGIKYTFVLWEQMKQRRASAKRVVVESRFRCYRSSFGVKKPTFVDHPPPFLMSPT